MKRIGRKVVLTLQLMFVFHLQAFSVELQLRIDRATVTTSEGVNVKVTVEGKDVSNYPKLETNPESRVKTGGVSSQMSIVNGAVSSSKSFTYTVFPSNEGTLIIGPATTEIDGRTYKSNVARVKVVKESESRHREREAFITATLNKSQAFVNQQLIYTFKFYSKGNARNASLELPKFEGFWVEELGEEQRTQEIVDGVAFDVVILKKALFPTAEGIYNIPETVLNADLVSRRRRRRGSIFEDLFGGGLTANRKVLKSARIKLEVKKLPTAPAGSNSILIGEFMAQSSLSKSSVEAGESITYTIEIQGKGNVRDANFPELKIKGAKVYKDKPNLKVGTRGESVIGSKTIKLAIVPQHQGKLTVPEIIFDYYNPTTNSWDSAKTRPQIITVAASETKESVNHVGGGVTSKKKSVEVVGVDLMGIKRNIYPFVPSNLSRSQKLGYLGVILGFPLVYIMTLFLVRRRERFLGDSGLVRSSTAYRKFVSNISKIKDDSDHQQVSLALRTYIGDRMNIDGMGLTAIDISTKLGDRVSNDLQYEIKKILSECDQAMYGGASVNVNGSEIKSLVKSLEKEFTR